MTENKKLRQEIITRACDFCSSGLGVGKSGNISARCEQGFFITPTGFNYEELEPEDVVYCGFEGNVIEGSWAPSSEWPFHAAIYKARKDVKAIVHCHSPYATAIACCRKPIPAFHYMVAVSGGKQIECAAYATFGSEALSKHVVDALGERSACLLANHGQVTVSDSVSSAFKLAEEVESLAKQYSISLQFGDPVLLDDEEMALNLQKFKSYGKQQGTD